MKDALAIVCLAVAGAALYGVVHDQITIRVCPEYFTVTHPRVIASDSHTLIALAWGIVATWQMGVGLGVLLAIAARAGSEPRLRAREMVRPVLVLLVVMGACALAAGVTGAVLSSKNVIALSGELAANIPREA